MCHFRKDNGANTVREAQVMLSPFMPEKCTIDEDVEEIFDGMKETTKHQGIKAICRKDTLINEFTKSLLGRLGTEEEQRRTDKDTIRTKVRTVGRLLKKLNESTDSPKDLNWWITGKRFDNVVQGVKKVAAESNSPSMAITLRHYIKHIALLKGALAIRYDSQSMKTEKKNFLELYSAHWKNQVASVANRRIRLRAMNRTTEIPRTEDLLNMKNSTSAEISSTIANFDGTYNMHKRLSQLVLVRLVLFNKRRIMEV